MIVPTLATIRRTVYAVDLAASRAICFYLVAVLIRLVEQRV